MSVKCTLYLTDQAFSVFGIKRSPKHNLTLDKCDIFKRGFSVIADVLKAIRFELSLSLVRIKVYLFFDNIAELEHVPCDGAVTGPYSSVAGTTLPLVLLTALATTTAL